MESFHLEHLSIGSCNPAKVKAAEEALREFFSDQTITIAPLKVSSQVRAQPLSLDETVQGAKNRARAAYSRGLSIGIEGGLMHSLHANTEHFEICACAFFDGTRYYVGLSSAFEHPQMVIDLVLREKLTVSAAYHKAGLTTETDLGATIGAIGLLSKQRLVRKDYAKQAIFCALVNLVQAYNLQNH